MGLPNGGLIFDRSGNLYGSTTTYGSGGGGTAFELVPSSGNWTFSLLYSFGEYINSGGPYGSLTMDAADNLYGTTLEDGAYGYGSVFKLTPSSGSWTYTSLHDFTGGSDGGYPWGNVVFDMNGNIYSTTWLGGTHGAGVVFEITP